MGLNVIAPIVISYLYLYEKMYKFYIAALLFIICLIILRSSSSFVGLFGGVVISLISYMLFNRKAKRDSSPSVKKGKGFFALIFISMFIFLFSLFFDQIIQEAAQDFLLKVQLAESSVSASARLNGWIDTILIFYNSDSYIFGLGTGYMSVNHESSFSWFLSVLVENGIVGFSLFGMVLISSFYRIIKIRSSIKYGLIISLISVIIHLFTQTGFYAPFLWLILVLSQYNWDRIDSFFYKKSSKNSKGYKTPTI